VATQLVGTGVVLRSIGEEEVGLTQRLQLHVDETSLFAVSLHCSVDVWSVCHPSAGMLCFQAEMRGRTLLIPCTVLHSPHVPRSSALASVGSEDALCFELCLSCGLYLGSNLSS
jgi:hypothetical protein